MLIKSLDRIEIRLAKMNKRIEPQQFLENISNINKSDHDIIDDMLLSIEEDLRNVENIENLDNYQRNL